MRVLLSTLNAKYIHSSLALAYLYEYCRDENWDIELREFSINERNENIMAEIFGVRPDVLAFSAYIWNIKPILEICRDYRQVSPHTVIILGGPEVSYDSCTVLQENPNIDYIVRGEGEETLKELLAVLYAGQPPGEVEGMSCRKLGIARDNPDRPLIFELDGIPFPYREKLDGYQSRIVYYEASRGCPYNCSYCLSSTIKGVRIFSLERVKQDLFYLIRQGVKEVKFVDRTFNCNEKRAREIMEYILEQPGTSKFHFEIAAEIMSDRFLSFLAQVPPGRFDFEIGVQSTHPDTLRAVARKSDWKGLGSNIEALIAPGNIHIHLDLIAGLPHEDYDTFAKSFNQVYKLGADVIQLGFLKLLKGSAIRSQAHEHSYVFQTEPPYQVLANKYLGYEQILRLKRIEDLLSRYYNSGFMTHTLLFIVEKIFSGQAFEFYEQFARYWERCGLFPLSHKKETEYSILARFIGSQYQDHQQIVNESLKFDFFYNNRANTLPRDIHSFNPANITEILYSLLKDPEFIQQNLPEMQGKTAREIRRQVHLEYFRCEPETGWPAAPALPILFVYRPVEKRACKVIRLPGAIYNES